MLSFAVDQFAHGGDVWFFKHTNLMIHALCGALIFWLTGRLLQQHTTLAPQRWWLALWVTAMWLLTPMQVSTVLYVVQRMTQLSAFFSLAGLLCYVIGRQYQLTEKKRWRGIGLVLSCFFLWLPLATFSKETGALLPLLAFMIELYFFRFRASPTDKRLLVIVYGIFLVLPALVVAGKILLDPGFFLNGYGRRDFTLMERLLTESRILFVYIKGLILPDGTALGLYHDDYMKSTGLLSPWTTLVSLLGWLVILILGYLARAKPVVALLFFGVFFYLSAHALESTIFSLELYFEHRNYLPAYGIFLSVVLILFYLLQQKIGNKSIKNILIVFLFALPASHAVASYQRVQTWTSFERILLAAQYTHPESLRVHGDLALYYYNMRDFDRAIPHLERVKELDPSSASTVAIHRIIAHCLSRRDIPRSEYDNLQENLPTSGLMYLTGGVKALLEVVRRKQCPQLDVDSFAGILGHWLMERTDRSEIDKLWLMNIHLAQMLEYSGKFSQALPYLDRAAEMYPSRLESGLLKIRNQLRIGDISGAQKTLVDAMKNDLGTRPDQSKALLDYEQIFQALNKVTTSNSTAPNPNLK
jgi:tetratricopeptide (TPR) repeat protein